MCLVLCFPSISRAEATLDDVVGQLQLLVQQANPLTYITSYPQQQVLGQIATNTANVVQAIYDMQAAGGPGSTINGDVTINGGTAGLATQESLSSVDSTLTLTYGLLSNFFLGADSVITSGFSVIPTVNTSVESFSGGFPAGNAVASSTFAHVQASMSSYGPENLAGVNSGEWTGAPAALQNLWRDESTFRLGSLKEEFGNQADAYFASLKSVYGPPATTPPPMPGIGNYGIKEFIPDAIYGMRFDGVDRMAPLLPMIRLFLTWAFTAWASVGIFRWCAWGLGIGI